MSRLYQIHVDTTSQTAFTSTAPSPSTLYVETVYKTNNNPFQCTIVLGQPIRRLKSFALKCAEIPISFYNIRAPYNSLTLNVASVLTTYTVPPGNYTTGTLLSSLNGLVTSGVGQFATNPSTNRVTFTSAVGSQIIIPVTQRSLAYFLGFTNGQSVTGVGNAVTATNSYMINFDTYVNVYIENLRASSQQPMVPVTFKIPITVANGAIENYFENTRFRQCIETYDPNFRIDRLNIIVYDRYGNILDNNGVDWSFTLEMEADT
jgi:hypothetical protein